MNIKIKVVQKAVIEVSLVVSIILVIGPAAAFGYWKNVHQQITSNAIAKSSLTESVKQIGFADIDSVQVKGSLKDPKSISDWIEYGSEFEDLVISPRFVPPLSYNGILKGHFYNPINDLGLTDDNGDPIGQSLIERANDPINEWSYQMVKDLYYAALTGDSTKHETWVMRDRSWQGAATLFGEENMNQEKRERFFAWTFQALGHTLHLIQDASVPAHTRNDSHIAIIEYDPFERWTRQNAKMIEYTGAGSDPWPHWNDHPTIKAPNVFIDTHRSPEQTSPPSEDLNQGLAEYSHANFLSNDSIFSQFSYPQLPRLWGEFPNYDANDVYFKGEIVNGTGRQFIYVKSNTYPNGVKHLVICGLLYHINFPTSATVYEPMYTVDDPNVYQNYAEKLIPRAVGYSAGLLDYFFRGKLEISAPDEFVYSIIDGSIAPHAFTHIKAKVRNSTLDEEMQEGTLVAVAKYKKRTDYQTDLSTDPPTAASSEADFSYSVSAPIGITSLSPVAAEEFLFDFSVNPIPAGITDLYLQVIFRGTLGNESDAIAVGMRDLDEPAYATFWNSTDEIPTSDNSTLVPHPDGGSARDFIIAFTGENPDPDNDGTAGFDFYDAYEPLVVAEDLPPGRYVKIVVLLENADDKYIAIDSGDLRCITPWIFRRFDGVIYQEGETYTELLPPPDGIHRGVRQHHFYYQHICNDQAPSCDYMDLADQRSVPAVTPFPIGGNINFPDPVYYYDPPSCF
jgi:hypothetical protein